MNQRLLHFLLILLAIAGFARVDAATTSVVNLTPAPARMSVSEGSFIIPEGFTVALPDGLPADMATEADKFVELYAAATGNQGRVTTAPTGTFTISLDSKKAPEGYSIKVTTEGVAIAASTPRGLYYAFQSIRKMLPANVMAGIPSDGAQVYALPIVQITDQPRYAYRGFMLDVARHFFDVNEVKRILDLMSFYKLNTFHFHLTDDQGWRFPVDKYPLLTTIGATAPNAQFVDMKTKTEVWLNRPYGPFAYTKDELRDIVAYAAERHIEVIPEVEMPGHFSAAIAAYPFLSCDPDGSHSVAQTGGIYADVLNIGNPAAVAFAKDVLTELMDVFPSKRIHIGGDECPDNRWKTNVYCQNKMTALGLTEARALQSHFTEEMAAFAAEHGRELIVWNESLTAGGTDIEAIKRANPTIMCWVGAGSATDLAQRNGLKYIYTPQGNFYVNRRLPGDDIPANGPGDCSPTQIYNTSTPTSDYCIGIQGTFWTERVATPDYLEYLLLPRLMAIAENAWTPVSRRDYDSFTTRMSADAPLLTLLGYNFYTGPAGGIVVSDPVAPAPATFTKLVEGKTYTFANAVAIPTLSSPTMIADLGDDRLGHSSDPEAANIWRVASARDNADGSQEVTLINVATSRAIAVPAAFEAGYGQGARLGSSAAALTVRGVTPSKTISLGYGKATLWPLSATSRKYPSTITAGNSDNAALPAAAALGAEWIATEVTPVTFVCQADGTTIATKTMGLPVGATVDELTAPVIPGYTFVSASAVTAGSVNATYRRTEYFVTFTGATTDGALLPDIVVEAPADKPYTVNFPDRPAMTLVSSSQSQGASLNLTTDLIITATYSTDAILGVKALGEPVSELKAGNSYVVWDAHADRNAYRVVAGNIVGGKRSFPLGPEAVWQFVAGARGTFALLNPASGKYVGTLPRGASCPLSDTPVSSTFTWNVDHWNIKQGTMAWDGGPDFTLHGWSDDGHPYQIYEFVASPYYKVTSEAYDEGGNLLGTSEAYGAAGESFIYSAPAYKDFYLKSMEGHYGLDCLTKNHTVKLVYSTDPTTGLETITSADAPARIRGIYDLSGRRLTRIVAPGIYIIDGVKTLIR